MAKSDTGEQEPILVYVGLDLLGDGLMKLPAVRALRNAYPAARITWVAGKGRSVYAGVLAPLVTGLIDEVIEDAGIGSRPGDILARPLEGRRFELVLDTQRRLLTTLAVRRIRHGRFVSGAARYLLSDVRPPRPFAHRKPPAMVDQMLELVALARTGRPDAMLDTCGPVTLPEAACAEAARRLPDGARYVALAPGAGMNIKRWPLERFIELGRRLAGRGIVPAYILGPGESDWVEDLRRAVPAGVVPLDPRRGAADGDPLLTVALAARCDACVANDSGGGHLLAASGRPLVTLFGPTTAAKFAPRVPHLSVIEAQAFGDSSMAAIPLGSVEDAVLAFLEA